MSRVNSAAWRAAFWVCFASVFYLALAPQNMVVSPFSWHKLNHACAFAALGILGSAGWPAAGKRRVLLWLFAFGCLIEVLQGFTETRTPDLMDALADAVGLGLAAFILKLTGLARITLHR